MAPSYPGGDERCGLIAHPDAARELLRVSLSVRGFETARNVIKLNEVLGEITGNGEFFGEWFYFLCIFGTPSMDEPWGWQIDGHHLNHHDVVLKDHVVMTLAFWGAEPAIADRGPYAGLRAFDAEQRNGLERIRALSLPQQEQAMIFKSILSTDLPDVYQPSAASHDQVWREEIKQHLSETWFAWMGSLGDTDVLIIRCTVQCCLLSLTWRTLCALLNTFGESVVTPSAVGSRFTF